MKSGIKNKAFAVLICFIIGIAFVVLGYVSLSVNTKKTVDKSVSRIPYAADKPENVGLLFDVSGNMAFFYLDFEEGSVRVIIPNIEIQINECECSGYPITYRIMGDYQLAADLIDRMGGIDVDLGEGEMCYKGVQITEMLSRIVDCKDIKQMIISATLKKISDNGIEMSDLVYIIENSETELNVPECYYWPKYLKEICGDIKFVN